MIFKELIVLCTDNNFQMDTVISFEDKCKKSYTVSTVC